MDLQEYYKKLAEQLPEGSLPENFANNVPQEVQNEFTSRFKTPEDPNYDVNISATTVPMRGRADSLPQASLPTPDVSVPQKPIWELEEDAPSPTSAPAPITSMPDSPKKESSKVEPGKEMNTLFPTDNDKAAREAGLADLEKRRKLGIIPQTLAGIGDTISASASAFGGNAPGGSMQRLIERQDKDLAQGQTDIETKLRNDAGSDISKQYQALLGQFLKKDPSDPAILGLTANQIAEKIPQVEKLATLRQQDELKRLQIDANKEARLTREAAAKDKLDEKSKLAQEKKEASINEAKQQAGIIRGTIKDILKRDLIGFDTAGPAASKWIAPLDYPDLASKLDTVAGNIAFTTLNKMRQNSPTGGAVGQVSDRDMALLASVKGSLKQEQSPAQLKETLKRLDELYTKVEGYDADITTPWKDTSPTQPRQTKSGHSYIVEP